MLSLEPLRPDDRAVWEELFRAYIAFYERSEPQSMYDRAWDEFSRGERMHALGARLDDRLVGLVHFLVHANTSGADVCYLEDLFTAPDVRGQGVGRALITAVADWARHQDCGRVYWMTQTTNATARRLYDSVAQDSGFMVYRLAL